MDLSDVSDLSDLSDPMDLEHFTIGRTGEKGVRTLLCEAPEGPFRQKGPDPFFSCHTRVREMH